MVIHMAEWSTAPFKVVLLNVTKNTVGYNSDFKNKLFLIFILCILS